jgi:hypothetical protein
MPYPGSVNDQVVAGLIGAIVPTVSAVIAFVYGYGRLTKAVDNLEHAQEKVIDQLNALSNVMVEVRERVARLESQPR